MNDPTTISDDHEETSGWQTELLRTLSNRDRDIFLALLDADPEPTEAAKKAAARFKEGYFVGEVYHFSSPETDDAPR